MRILVSNDDGVYAEGITALAQEVSSIADVVVVAPDRNNSAASNSLTINNPIRVVKIKDDFISVQGTPTDCVHIGITGLLQNVPDMVISGINEGANLGDDILYSGTVAAATEGRFLGIPSIAFSLAGGPILTHYKTAAKVAKWLIGLLVDEKIDINTVLNVNVPDVPINELQGYEITRQGKRHCSEATIKMKDPRGHDIYWVGPPGAEQDAGPGTDFHAISNNKVSITPLHMDFTDYKMMEKMQNTVRSFVLD